ncbi:Arm DNA-binding domain-containing protein [Flagellimonas marinaquae]
MKSKHTFTVIFFTRKSRSIPNQLSIYVRITVDGQRAEISLKRNIPSKEWDSSRNRGRGGSQRIRALNAYLDSVLNY